MANNFSLKLLIKLVLNKYYICYATVLPNSTNFNEISNKQLLENLKTKIKEIEFYELQFKSGENHSAAFDWTIITNTSSVITIFSFLWQVYSKLIKPNKKPDSTGGIIFKIENTKIHDELWIGNNINSENELEEKIKDVLDKININEEEANNKVDEIRNSEHWKRLK